MNKMTLRPHEQAIFLQRAIALICLVIVTGLFITSKKASAEKRTVYSTATQLK